MDEFSIRHLLPKRPRDSHKGTFGHVLNLSGCGNYVGASYFSSIAPLKVGCGRSTLASVESVIRSVSSLSPDIILMRLPQTCSDTISSRAINMLIPILKKYDAISVGCGLSLNGDTAKFFRLLMKELNKLQIPTVIDADALTILAGFKHITLPEHVILTPHPMELSRLLGIDVDEILEDPEFYAKKCSKKYDCVTVLKTHQTIIVDKNGEPHVNHTGNSALAHGGSGDVLTGIISGFLAQGLVPYEASILAVHLHGKTAEIASKELTEYSTLASNLLDYIPRAIKEVI